LAISDWHRLSVATTRVVRTYCPAPNQWRILYVYR